MTDEKTRPDTDLPVGFASTTGLRRDEIIDGPAGHLRNVLRKIQHILRYYSEDPEGTKAELLAICHQELTKPLSDGPVIDALRRRVGDLESQTTDLVACQLEIDDLKGTIRRQEEELAFARQENEQLQDQLARGMRREMHRDNSETAAAITALKDELAALRESMISGGKTDTPEES